LTSSLTHGWRLLKWGRTLAKHGALRGIERDPLAPPQVRRLVRILRLGANLPEQPRYAAAFETLGPAAIKLGQALATRPDLVGDAAATDLFRLQDALPPAPFAAIRAAVEQGLGKPIEAVFRSFDEKPVGAASIAQVHKAVTTEGRTVAVKVLRPGVEDDFARAIETYEWAAAQAEQMGGEIARLRPRLVIATFRQWTARELDLRREAASASELAENMAAIPGFVVPEIDWGRSSRRVMTMGWMDGIKLSDRAGLIAAGHDLPRSPRDWSRPSCARRSRTASSTPISTRAICSPWPTAGSGDRLRHHGPDRPPRAALAGRDPPRLITGNYRRVAEIHFEAGYVPPHHNVAEFTTALRAVGEPIRGLRPRTSRSGRCSTGCSDHPRFRHADPAASAAAAEDDGDGRGRRDQPRSRPQHVGHVGSVREGMDAVRTRPRSLARRPHRRGRPHAGGAARTGPPDRGQIPRPRRCPPAPPLRDVQVIRIGGGWRYALFTILGVAAGIAGTLLLA
jgi:ubiquinone biosynthesis protein